MWKNSWNTKTMDDDCMKENKDWSVGKKYLDGQNIRTHIYIQSPIIKEIRKKRVQIVSAKIYFVSMFLK